MHLMSIIISGRYIILFFFKILDPCHKNHNFRTFIWIYTYIFTIERTLNGEYTDMAQYHIIMILILKLPRTTENRILMWFMSSKNNCYAFLIYLTFTF